MNLTKTRKILLITLSILISISIVLVLYNKMVNNADEGRYYLSKEEVEKIKEESNPIKDYDKFYTINSACKNYTNYLLSKDYSTTYKILSNSLKSKMSASTYTKKIEEYVLKNFVTENLDNLYDVENSLYRAYPYTGDKKLSSVYICEIRTLNEDEYLNIAIRLITSGKPRYEILYVGI